MPSHIENGICANPTRDPIPIARPLPLESLTLAIPDWHTGVL